MLIQLLLYLIKHVYLYFKGVVVVEDIKRAKAILKEPNTTVDQMIECLSGLEKKIPSRKVLLETKIGTCKIVLAQLKLYESNRIKIKSSYAHLF